MSFIRICSNGCGRKTDNEYGVCRPCVKKLCTSLDSLPQIENYSYGDKPTWKK